MISVGLQGRISYSDQGFRERSDIRTYIIIYENNRLVQQGAEEPFTTSPTW